MRQSDAGQGYLGHQLTYAMVPIIYNDEDVGATRAYVHGRNIVMLVGVGTPAFTLAGSPEVPSTEKKTCSSRNTLTCNLFFFFVGAIRADRQKVNLKGSPGGQSARASLSSRIASSRSQGKFETQLSPDFERYRCNGNTGKVRDVALHETPT